MLQPSETREAAAELLERIRVTMGLCEDFACGGIGPDGPTQADLDSAIAAGHPIEHDDTVHRGQQIWLNLNEIARDMIEVFRKAGLSEAE